MTRPTFTQPTPTPIELNTSYWQNVAMPQNPAQYIFDGEMVSLSGLIQYTSDTTPMGEEGRGIIGWIDNSNACPAYTEVFTVTNGFGLDCVVQVKPVENDKCAIYLVAWSIPQVYYYTGAYEGELRGGPILTGYYVVDNAELIAAGNDISGTCRCEDIGGGQQQSACVHIYVDGDENNRHCIDSNDMKHVALDGIVYIAQNDEMNGAPRTGPITLTSAYTATRPATYEYNGFVVGISGLIQYNSDLTGPMGQALGGKIGDIDNTDLCPAHNEIFAVTNGFGLDITVELEPVFNGDECVRTEIYLLSWSVPLAYYYTGANEIEYRGGPVNNAYYIMDNAEIVAAGSDVLGSCKCEDGSTDSECVHVYIDGVTKDCVQFSEMRYISLDGIVYVPSSSTRTTGTSGTINLDTNPWENAVDTNGNVINPARSYKYNGWRVSLFGLLRYTGTDPMGSDGDGLIGSITNQNSDTCPIYSEIFRLTNGFGVDCTVAVTTECNIDLLAWSIPTAYYYTGAYGGQIRGAPVSQSYWVVDNAAIVATDGNPRECQCDDSEPPQQGCYYVYIDQEPRQCVDTTEINYVSLDGIAYNGGYVEGQPAIVSGDPHFETFDDSKHDLQGKIRTGKTEFYYLVSCDINYKNKIPYSMIGKHIRYKRDITALDYVTLELFDNNNVNYLVFLSSDIRYYTIETDKVSTLYDINVKNGISLTTLSIGKSINIGDRFVILVKKPNSNQIDVTLTIDGNCQLIFTMKAQRRWSGRARMHYLRVMPPNCYKQFICGVLGDFKERGFRSQKIAQCNGDIMSIKDGMNWKKIYDSNGWSWEKTYVDGYCNENYVEEDDEETAQCDESIKDEVIASCQKIRDDHYACCESIGGDFCNTLQTWCEFDVCITSDGDSTQILSNVYDLFTASVVETCEDCAGCFGPIPKLLYEFDGDLTETQSNGDNKYNLQIGGDAYVANGVLNCDGTNDFVYGKYNLDFNMKSHSLSVLLLLDNLIDISGGTISIDSIYTSNEPDSQYEYNQFDSIVYNELNDRRWFSGSQGLERTQTGVGTQESLIREYIHLVVSYDFDHNKISLYRNGVKEQQYTSSGFLQVVENEGYRIMFCQRNMDDDNGFAGKIKFGAIYDYSLSSEQVSVLYENCIVNVFGIQYEVIGDDLLPDKTLQTGQALRSTNQRYVAVLQHDGNFVVYDLSQNTQNEAILFSTNTGNAESDETRYLIYQSSDGNLLLYGNEPYDGNKYSSNIADNDGTGGTGFLIMENDGSLIIYNGNNDVKWSSNIVKGGDGFIQFGTFRVGFVDDNHFSISSVNNKKTSIIFRNDGRIFGGPRNDWGLWNKQLLGRPINVDFTEHGIEFGDYWCLGMSWNGHLSITHNNNNHASLSPKTAMIWRWDGTRHGGPRNDFSCWSNKYKNTVSFGVASNGLYIQFNDGFRIGNTGLNSNKQEHLSIASKRTCVIYRDDGTIHRGPRDGWAWNGWSGSSSAKTQILSLDEMNNFGDTYSKLYNEPYSYSISDFIGIIILILILVNIICMVIYCKKIKYDNNKPKVRKYSKVISLDTDTDIETDTDIHD